MSSISLYDNTGGLWMLGVAAADRYPLVTSNAYLAGVGAADPATSYLLGAKAVQIIGVQVTTAAAVNIDVIWHDTSSAAVIAGLTRSAAAVGWFPFGHDGVRFEKPSGIANVGLRCGAGAVATLFYRKLL